MKNSINPLTAIENCSGDRFSHEIGALVIGGNYHGLGVLRGLSRYNVPTCLLDSGLNIGRFSRYAGKYFRCPPIRDKPLFFEFLKNLALKEKVEGWIIYPVDNETVDFLSRYKKLLEKYYRIATPGWDVIRFISEKKLTYQLAQQFDIPIPRTFFPRDLLELNHIEIDFPVVIKPSSQDSSVVLNLNTAITAHNRRELIQSFERVREKVPQCEMVIQEIIPGGSRNLYSVSSFFKVDELLGKVVVRQIRQYPGDFGMMTGGITVEVPILEQTSRRFLRAMGYYGLSEIKYIFDKRDSRYKLIEINAHAQSWESMTVRYGMNLPYLLYRDILGQKISPQVFQRNAIWFHLMDDLPAVVSETLRGRLSFSATSLSFYGLKHDTVLSLKDPLPFIAEMLLSPYFRIKRWFQKLYGLLHTPHNSA